MPSREDWIVGGIIAAILAALGISLTYYVLVRKKKAEAYTLRRISHAERQPILTNLERVKLIRDREGNLKELVIHREIHG